MVTRLVAQSYHQECRVSDDHQSGGPQQRFPLHRQVGQRADRESAEDDRQPDYPGDDHPEASFVPAGSAAFRAEVVDVQVMPGHISMMLLAATQVLPRAASHETGSGDGRIV
jgi:hypothetical protein